MFGTKGKCSAACAAVALCCIAIIAAVWGVTAQRIAFERQDEIRQAVRQHSNLALALEEHTVRTVKSVDQALLFLKHEFELHGRVDVAQLVHAGKVDGSALTAMLVIDERGRVISRSSDAGEAASFADNDAFRAHRDSTAPGLLIGEPRKGRVSVSYTIPFSRRLSARDGSFGGMVAAGLSPEYFSRFYDLVDLGRGGVVILAGLDGILRARRSEEAASAGLDVRGSSLLRLAAASDAGSFESLGQLDGVVRYLSFRTLRDLGLIVAVGNSKEQVLAEANRRMGWYLLGSTLATLFVVLFGGGLVVAWRRQQRSMAAAIAGERLYRVTMEEAPVGVTHQRMDGRFLRANPRYCEMVGYSEEELRSRRFQDLLHPDDAPSREEMEQLMATGRLEREARHVRRDGAVIWGLVAVALMRDAEGRADYTVAMVQDITARKQAQERLVRQASYDALTDLPNRSLLFDRLAQALSQARRKNWTAGVLFVDLDRFKTVNDTLGHEKGDRLLREAAARLAAIVRGGDTVARVGGDEFVIALPELAAPQDAARVATKIIEAMAQPFALGLDEVYVTASVGIATFPADGDDGATLVKNADAAMTRAKEIGRSTYQFYTAAMNVHATERLRLEGDLRRALERREFFLHFQPRAHIGGRSVSGFEALLRWQRAGNGMVSPAQFIPLLEESGLIVPVGEWVIGAACAQIRAWRDAGFAPAPVAVNVAAKQFLHGDLCEVVDRALHDHGVPAGLLEIEITESGAMQDPARTIAILEGLKGRGIKVAIDDFGTGYSSLGYLKRFPVDLLKLDRSFVTGLPGDADDVSIARAVIAMAHSLGLKVVAEGVETEEQRAFLARNGCDQMQGYLFSRPLPAADCTKYLAAPQAVAA